MPGKRKKKKSSVVKDCVDPTFNEEFDFSIDFKDLPNHWLKVRQTLKKKPYNFSLSFAAVRGGQEGSVLQVPRARLGGHPAGRPRPADWSGGLVSSGPNGRGLGLNTSIQ